MFNLKEGQLTIFLVNLIALIVFTIHFMNMENYEFLLYVGVIIFFFVVILATNHKVYYPNMVLWGLTLWSLLHMGGGGLYFNGVRLYEIILIPITETMFRYDQFVHIIGFGVATFVMYAILQPILKPNLKTWTSVGIITVMAGLGVGGLNEIIEFITDLLVPQSGVGGYLNMALDMVADLIGAIIAWIIIYYKGGKI